MELSKKSELTVGSASYVINTELAGENSQSIRTQVVSNDGSIAFETSQDISSLRPIFQNSQQVFARLEAQHQNVVKELQEGRLGDSKPASVNEAVSTPAQETDALEHAVSLLGSGNFEKATAALRAVLATYPNCSEARELLEVAYKASSGTRLPIDTDEALRRGTAAFAAGRQRDAIEAWKQCLIEEPGNRLLQLLVMLATTWSAERRQHYANEVLSAGSDSLSAGRPAEAQALLLIAQTVEGGLTGQGTGPPPPPRPAPESAFASDPDAPETQEIEANLESLVLDATETDAVTSEPAPSAASPGIQDASTIVKPPSFLEVEAPENAAEPPITASASPAPPSPPPVKDGPTVAPPPSAAASSPPSEDRKPETMTEEEAKTSPPPPPRPAVRRPMGRARSRSAPWPWIAAGVAGVAVIALVAVWLLSGDGTVPGNRLEQAASYVGSGQYGQAIAAYDGMIHEFGDHAEIYLGRGRAKVASGDTEGGLDDLRRARDLDPDAPAISEEIGDVYYSSGNYPQAIDFYENAFANGGGSAEGRYRLAASYVQQDDGDAALEHLRVAIGKDPQHGEAQFLYGVLLNDRARFEEAESAFRSAEPHVEGGSDYLAELAISLLGQEKLDEAEEVAHTFLRNYPSDARAHSVLGEVFLIRRQYEQARAELIQALRTDPNEPRAQIALGRTWLAIGKTQSDPSDLAKARQVLTNASGVHEGQRLLALGQVSLAEGDLDTAQRLLQQSLGHGAPPLPVHLALAESKARGDDLVGAAEELQRAAGLAPDDPAISLSLAIAYSRLDDADRAAELFLKSIQGVGLVSPPGPDAGPVMLPAPHLPLPERFDINRAIRNAHRAVLAEREDDPAASELRTLAESTTFVLGTS